MSKPSLSSSPPRKNLFWALLILLPAAVYGECTCEPEEEDRNKSLALKYKVAAIVSILAASTVGVLLPGVGKRVPALSPESNLFYVVKAFAAGVILSTGFIHVLPDAFESLTSPCISASPWGDFPFAGFVAMVAAIGTLMVDTYASSYYQQRSQAKMTVAVDGDEERAMIAMHTHATHGHAHGPVAMDSGESDLLRHRVISQVLELGIIVHSVIIGIALGASESPKTIKPLIAALTFHQFFEGIGLGGCITQARFNSRTVALMALFFSLTTPTGIAAGTRAAAGNSHPQPAFHAPQTPAAVHDGTLNQATTSDPAHVDAAADSSRAASFSSPSHAVAGAPDTYAAHLAAQDGLEAPHATPNPQKGAQVAEHEADHIPQLAVHASSAHAARAKAVLEPGVSRSGQGPTSSNECGGQSPIHDVQEGSRSSPKSGPQRTFHAAPSPFDVTGSTFGAPSLAQRSSSLSIEKQVNNELDDILECPLNTQVQDFNFSSTSEAEISPQSTAIKVFDKMPEPNNHPTQVFDEMPKRDSPSCHGRNTHSTRALQVRTTYPSCPSCPSPMCSMKCLREILHPIKCLIKCAQENHVSYLMIQLKMLELLHYTGATHQTSWKFQNLRPLVDPKDKHLND